MWKDINRGTEIKQEAKKIIFSTAFWMKTGQDQESPAPVFSCL